MFRGRVRHVHFVGIGGIGMSGLAEILRSLGFDVSGSDLKHNNITLRLEMLGVRIDLGHAAANVVGSDVVVYSSAIKPDNAELTEARARGIPVIARAEMLAELMRDEGTASPSPGSHGKTTTTSLISTVLRSAGGLDPTVVIGGKMAQQHRQQRPPGPGRVSSWPRPTRATAPSSGSMPTIAVVTNIDAGAPRSLPGQGSRKIREAFRGLPVAAIPFYGLAVHLPRPSATSRTIMPRNSPKRFTSPTASHDRRRITQAQAIVESHGLTTTVRGAPPSGRRAPGRLRDPHARACTTCYNCPGHGGHGLRAR